MKNVLFLFLSLALSISAIAQKKMTEGVIVLELTEIDSDDPSMAGMLSSMKGGTMETVFTSKNQKSTMKMMGGMVTTQTYIDVKAKKSKTYMDMMGNKIALKLDAEEASKASAETDVDIVETKETKVIKGYKTKKYIIKPKGVEMNGGEISIYVAEDIQVGTIDLGNNMTTSKLKGAPLEMNMKMQGMSMVYTLKSIDEEVPANAFKEPTGYKEMTMEEFQKSMGGMGF